MIGDKLYHPVYGFGRITGENVIIKFDLPLAGLGRHPNDRTMTFKDYTGFSDSPGLPEPVSDNKS